MAKRERNKFPMLIGSFEKSDAEDVRVELDQFHDWNVVSLAVWYMTKGGTLAPRHGGVVMRVERLPRLITLLEKALEEAIALGMLADD